MGILRNIRKLSFSRQKNFQFQCVCDMCSQNFNNEKLRYVAIPIDKNSSEINYYNLKYENSESFH